MYINGTNLTGKARREAFKRYYGTRYQPYSAEEREEMDQMRRDDDEQTEQMMQALNERIIAERHSAFAGILAYLETHGKDLARMRDQMSEGQAWTMAGAPIGNDECQLFALEQIAKVGKQEEGAIRQELRIIYADVQARGGDAYAAHKARLQALNR